MSCKLASWGIALAALLSAASAQARVFRARFDPETLALEKPGNLQCNVQAGGLYGDGIDGSRIILPDFELDLGVLKWLEVSIDGVFTVTNLGTPELGVGGDPLWTSARFELLNLRRDDQEHTTFGMGLQVGPRFRTIDKARGVGLGALLLAGGGTESLRVVANLGTFLDREQAGALVYGGSVEYDLALRHAGRHRSEPGPGARGLRHRGDPDAGALAARAARSVRQGRPARPDGGRHLESSALVAGRKDACRSSACGGS
jgi:hypothetical protein